MANSFYSQNPDQVKALTGRPVCIQEKVAMPHVWIRIDATGVYFLRDHKPITEIDSILDDTYSKIKEDFFEPIMDDSTIEKILKLCGPCDLKIFYLPNEKPFYMEYNYLYKIPLAIYEPSFHMFFSHPGYSPFIFAIFAHESPGRFPL